MEPAALRGVRVLVTRARGQADELSRLLRAAGADVVEIPTIEIVDPEDWGPADHAIGQLSSYRMVIFTSANGVGRFLQRMELRGMGISALRGAVVAAIGPATAGALRRHALRVDLVPEEFRAEGVLDEATRLLRLPPAAGEPAPRVLLPRAQEAREVLPDGLRARGAVVDVVAVYRTVIPGGSREAMRDALGTGLDVALFTSPSTVNHFARLAATGGSPLLPEGVAVGCIGPITAQAAAARGLRVDVQPDRYTVAALVEALVQAREDGKIMG